MDQDPELKELFDDFHYTDPAGMAANGWIIRSQVGWPGVPGAAWGNESISFVDDPDQPGNRLLRMSACTDGSQTGTRQAQICHQRKYFDGTYAARVRFRDAPNTGARGDQVVETFYLIGVARFDRDPLYSEVDFEYLPNGGWGRKGERFHFTTWHTYQLKPWYADNASDSVPGSQNGWHILVVQVAGGKVTYWVDGKKQADHGGKFYPRTPLSINFNLWFVAEGLLKDGELRQYDEDLDWVYHQVGAVLQPDEVEARVKQLREQAVYFKDSVPDSDPALPCPCNT